MYASATIAHTNADARRWIRVDSGDGQRTVRVRTGRGNARLEAINTSLGFRR